MPDRNKTKPQDGPSEATKKPGAAQKVKSAAREARLADALRENLRRRKQNSQGDEAPDTKEE